MKKVNLEKLNLTDEQKNSEGYLNFISVWDGTYKPNNSPKCKALKRKLEQNGHTNVYVWYEPVGFAMEMCGNEGGYMYSSDDAVVEPIGYSFGEAYNMLDNSWHIIEK